MTPTPVYLSGLTRPPTWRLRLAKRLRSLAARLDPDASVARNLTIDWEERILWATPGFGEVAHTLMLGPDGSIRESREYAGNRRKDGSGRDD